MIKKLIEKHIKKLTIQDIYNFASKNEINLTENEANYIYDKIKENWEELIFSDHIPILINSKNSLEKETYDKALELISFFKNKYKNYL